jgi:hypothetical protein
VSAVPRAATVKGVLYADVNENGAQDEGEVVTLASVQFTADANSTGARDASAFAQGDGNFTATLRPGAYTVTATTSREVTTAEGATERRTFELRETITVGVGETLERTFRMTPAAAAPS